MSRPKLFAKSEFAPRHIVITGASGGLGSALSRYYAETGVHLSLWGRNEQRLEVVANECRALGSSVSGYTLAVTDIQTALSRLRSCNSEMPIDCLILNAGVSDIRPSGSLTEKTQAVLDAALVNYASPVTLATEVASWMAKRRSGRIILIGSVAAHHDLPFASAYSSSKAGLSRFATCLHAAMAPFGVGVTLIEPGYIDTAMSRRLDGARPFLVSPDKAAQLIACAAAQNQAVLVFPKVFLFLKLLSSIMPRPIAHRLLRMAKVKQHAS